MIKDGLMEKGSSTPLAHLRETAASWLKGARHRLGENFQLFTDTAPPRRG